MRTDLDRLLTEAQVALAAAQTAVAQEIGAYPTPISGCDAQFNHLLAQRSRIGRALAALSAEVFVPTPRSPAPFAGIESR